jgi:hypothetical protein
MESNNPCLYFSKQRHFPAMKHEWPNHRIDI